jgi:hypothetical protein
MLDAPRPVPAGGHDLHRVAGHQSDDYGCRALCGQALGRQPGEGHIDQSTEARQAGLKLRDTAPVIFGNPLTDALVAD